MVFLMNCKKLWVSVFKKWIIRQFLILDRMIAVLIYQIGVPVEMVVQTVKITKEKELLCLFYYYYYFYINKFLNKYYKKKRIFIKKKKINYKIIIISSEQYKNILNVYKSNFFLFCRQNLRVLRNQKFITRQPCHHSFLSTIFTFKQ